jgi:hypothetical protein
VEWLVSAVMQADVSEKPSQFIRMLRKERQHRAELRRKKWEIESVKNEVVRCKQRHDELERKFRSIIDARVTRDPMRNLLRLELQLDSSVVRDPSDIMEIVVREFSKGISRELLKQ